MLPLIYSILNRLTRLVHKRLGKILVAAMTTLFLAGCDYMCPIGTDKVTRSFISIPEYPNTDMQEFCETPDGIRHGPYLVRNVHGVLVREGQYSMGIQCGLWIEYNEDGVVFSQEDYGDCSRPLE